MPTRVYPKYLIKKTELYHAGEILRQSPSPNIGDWLNAYDLLEKWRSMHAYPLNTFQANVRNMLKKNGLSEKALVAQRLKRLYSILLKLKRFSTMRLERMQDIGGLRIIVPTVKDVYCLVNCMKESKWKHKLLREKDYINEPPESGYRSYHLIYEYHNIQAPEEYQGLFVELQIRTQLQHVWATAVETVGTFLRQSLKSSQGPQDWLDYFKLASAAFAIEENTPISSFFSDMYPDAIVKELHKQTLEMHVFKKISNFHRTVDISKKMKFKNKYILLRLNLSNNTIIARIYNQNDLEKASADYGELEKQRNDDEDVVLVSSASLKDLRKAYPNYFVDINGFIKHLNRIFKKYNLTEIPADEVK